MNEVAKPTFQFDFFTWSNGLKILKMIKKKEKEKEEEVLLGELVEH